MRIVYMGTPLFAVNPLKEIADKYDVVCVVTQTDKKVGRKQEVKYSPVKEYALSLGIEVFQPEKIRIDYQKIIDMKPDLIVVCAYGQIIPEAIINAPRLGCVNIHTSLLPKLRGGAPIHKAIINGFSKSGITIMYMDKGMDTGDIITTEETLITDDDTAGSLHDRLSIIGAKLIVNTLPSIIDGTNSRTKQNDSEATYAYNLSREEELLDFSKTSREVFNQVRGMNPWPLAYMMINNQEVKVLECVIINDNSSTVPGSLIRVTKDEIIVKTSDGAVGITKIKPFGKKIMSVRDYLNGNKFDLVLK